MKDLAENLYAQFTASSTLSTALTNGLFHTEAAQDTDLPFGTFTIVSNVTKYTFAGIMEDTLVQFNLFSDRSDSQEVDDIYEKLKDVYDWLVIDDGNDEYILQRQSNRLFRAENVWQCVVEYRFDFLPAQE